jgi:tetratricopeptide (TPR) repeat protein
MAQPNVFLSHSSKDAAFTAKLETDLKDAGAKVHLVSEADGGDFVRRINDALAACEYVVLVLTQDALASPWVASEMNSAIRLMNQGHIKDILPIQIRPVDFTAIPPLWGNYNIFDATRRGYAKAKDDLLLAMGLHALPNELEFAPPPEDPADQIVPGVKSRHPHIFLPPGAGYGGLFTYVKKEASEQLLADADATLAHNPRDALAWVKKGVALNNLSRWDAALHAFERALAFDPNFAAAWDYKGSLLRDLGRYQESLDAYDRVLALDPNAADTWHEKADILRDLGRTKEAEEAAREAAKARGRQHS